VDINLNALGDALAPYARSAAASLPGGSTVLDVVNRYNASNRSAPTSRTGPAPTATTRAVVPWYQKPLVLAGAGLAVVGLLVALVFVRRR
jgi:hypothetical protein